MRAFEIKRTYVEEMFTFGEWIFTSDGEMCTPGQEIFTSDEEMFTPGE